jgi:hypothetical protein
MGTAIEALLARGEISRQTLDGARGIYRNGREAATQEIAAEWTGVGDKLIDAAAINQKGQAHRSLYCAPVGDEDERTPTLCDTTYHAQAAEARVTPQKLELLGID